MVQSVPHSSHVGHKRIFPSCTASHWVGKHRFSKARTSSSSDLTAKASYVLQYAGQLYSIIGPKSV